MKHFNKHFNKFFTKFLMYTTSRKEQSEKCYKEQCMDNYKENFKKSFGAVAFYTTETDNFRRRPQK